MNLSIKFFFVFSLSLFVFQISGLIASQNDFGSTEKKIDSLKKISTIFDRQNENFWPDIDPSNPDDKAIKKWVSSLKKINLFIKPPQKEVGRSDANSFCNARMQELMHYTTFGLPCLEELFESSSSNFHQFLALRSEYYRCHTMTSISESLLRSWRTEINTFFHNLGNSESWIECAFRSDVATVLSNKDSHEELKHVLATAESLGNAESHKQAAARFLKAARHPENKSPNPLKEMVKQLFLFKETVPEKDAVFTINLFMQDCYKSYKANRNLAFLQIYFQLWSLFPDKSDNKKKMKESIFQEFQEAAYYFWKNKYYMAVLETLYKVCAHFYGETLLDHTMEQKLKKGEAIKRDFEGALNFMKKERDFLFKQVVRRNKGQLEEMKNAFIGQYTQETILEMMNEIESENQTLNGSLDQDRALCDSKIKKDRRNFDLLQQAIASKKQKKRDDAHCKGPGLVPLIASTKSSNSISVAKIFEDDSDDDLASSDEEGEFDAQEDLESLISPRSSEDYNEWIQAGFKVTELHIKAWLETLKTKADTLEQHYAQMLHIALCLEGYHKREKKTQAGQLTKGAGISQNAREGQNSTSEKKQALETGVPSETDPQAPYDYPWFFLAKEKLSEIKNLPFVR